jgi:lysophospholipase L1-like esterase
MSGVMAPSSSREVSTQAGATLSAGAPHRRRRLHRVFGVLTALVLLAGQEILFRGLFPLPDVIGFNRMRYQMLFGAHPKLGESLKRGLVYDRLLLESQPDGYSEVHRLNLYGFRGPDFAIEPPSARRRILVIGDSIVEGQGAPESATITAELSRLLQADGAPAEVINLGVIAAALPHLTALVRDSVSVLKPTDVVVVVYANDLPAPPDPPDLDRQAPAFPSRSAPWWLPRAAELAGRVVRHEPIYRRWPHAPLRFFAPVPDPSNPWTRASGPPPGLSPALYRAMVAGAINPWLKDLPDAIPGMLSHDFGKGGSPVRYLMRMDAICRAAGARLVIAYVPFCGVVSERYASPLVELGMKPETAEALSQDPIYRRQNRMLADLCSALKLPLADATEDLVREEARGVPQFWSYDTHPRPAGYATIARGIHRALSAAPP